MSGAGKGRVSSEGYDQRLRSPRVGALTYFCPVAASVLKTFFVLSAPVTASLIGGVVKGRSSPPAPEFSDVLVMIGDLLLALGLVWWVLVVWLWLLGRLFITDWHLPMVNELLTVSALVLYLGAFTPILPYAALGPWGSGT